MNNNTFVNPTALSINTTNKEETTMTNKKNIFDAISEIKSDGFRQDMMRVNWETRNINLDYYKIFWDQDNILVIRLFQQNRLSDGEFHRIVHRFCEMGDSKKRCRELTEAFDRGEYICKKGHIDGRLVIIVQLLVD